MQGKCDYIPTCGRIITCLSLRESRQPFESLNIIYRSTLLLYSSSNIRNTWGITSLLRVVTSMGVRRVFSSSSMINDISAPDFFL